MRNDLVVSFLFKGYAGEVYGGERSAAQMLAHTTRPRPIVVLNVEDALADELRARGVDVLVVPIVNIFAGFRAASLGERASRVRAWLAYNARSFRLLRTLRPRVVHCNDVEAFVLAAPAALLARTPVVMHVRCERRMRWFHQLAMLLATRTVTVSRGIAELHVRRAWPLLRERIRRRTTVLHNGIALGELNDDGTNGRAAARRALGVRAEEHVVLVVGSLEERKGQLELLEGAGPRLAGLTNTHVYFVGGGKGDDEYRERCRDAARQSGLGDRVTFVGYTTRIFDWYRAADVVALPSYAEGLARTALEAGAFSRPVVAHAIPGMDEAIVDGESGFLVRTGAWDAFGDSLVALLADRDLRARMGAAARHIVEERFDIERCAAGFQSILQEAGR